MGRCLYAYAVVPAGAVPPRAEPILPGVGLLGIEESGLVALASPVPRAPFEAGPGCRTDEPGWLADRAARHHGVVVATAGPVLPLAFGAVFAGEAPLRDWIRARAARLAAALDAVADAAEWSVMLEETAPLHEMWLRRHEPVLARLAAQAAAAGMASATRCARRLEGALLAARQARLAEICQALGEALARQAQRLLMVSPQGVEGIAAWSLLLRNAAIPDLRCLLDEAAAAVEESGLTLRLSGPWPPYAYARAAVADA